MINIFVECCDTVYLSSTGIQSSIDVTNPKSVKLGSYEYQEQSNGKRAYKLITDKEDQEKEFFLHSEPLTNKWAVGYYVIQNNYLSVKHDMYSLLENILH